MEKNKILSFLAVLRCYSHSKPKIYIVKDWGENRSEQ